MTQVQGKPHTLAAELQSPAIQVKSQCWGRKASAEQLRQMWADMKPWVINSHQQKLSVAALLTVITMLWTLYNDLWIYSSLRRSKQLSCVERKRSRKKPLSKKNRMRDSEKSFWEKSGVGGLERRLRKKCVSVKMAQVFNIISLFLLSICKDACSQPTPPDTTFALYLYCQQFFLMRFTSLVVSVQQQP